MNSLAAILALDKLITGIVALLDVLGATQKVSDMIAARIASGGKSWTSEQLLAIQADVDTSRAAAQAAVAKAEATGQ